MTFTLTFSKKIDDINTPYYIDGVEQTLQVEADSKTGAIYCEATKKYCEDHGVTVRRVS